MIKPLLTYWKAVECLWLIPMECHQFRSRLPSFGCPVTRWKSLVARQTSRLKKRRFTTHLGTFQKSNPSNSLFPIKSIGCGRHQRYLNQISGWYFFNSILWKMPISVAHRNLQHFPFINNGLKTEKCSFPFSDYVLWFVDKLSSQSAACSDVHPVSIKFNSIRKQYSSLTLLTNGQHHPSSAELVV